MKTLNFGMIFLQLLLFSGILLLLLGGVDFTGTASQALVLPILPLVIGTALSYFLYDSRALRWFEIWNVKHIIASNLLLYIIFVLALCFGAGII